MEEQDIKTQVILENASRIISRIQHDLEKLVDEAKRHYTMVYHSLVHQQDDYHVAYCIYTDDDSTKYEQFDALRQIDEWCHMRERILKAIVRHMNDSYIGRRLIRDVQSLQRELEMI